MFKGDRPVTKSIMNIDFEEFVHIFNTYGKDYAKSFIENKYGKGYETVQRIVAKQSKYFFSFNKRKYELKQSSAIDAEFISIDDLYKGKNNEKVAIEPVQGFYKPLCFDDLIIDLIKDRVLEFSKYIVIDHANSKITVKSKLIESDGYEIIFS